MTIRNGIVTGLAALMGLSMMAVAARAGEEEVAFKDLPKAVQKAVKQKFPEAKIRGAAKEVEDGRTTYEVEMTVNGRDVDAAFNARGRILEIEREISVDKLPKAVKEKLKEKYPGAKIEKAEEITRGEDGPVRYEVVLKAEVVFDAKGKVVKGGAEEEDDVEKPAAKSRKGEKKEKEKEDDEEGGDDAD